MIVCTPGAGDDGQPGRCHVMNHLGVSIRFLPGGRPVFGHALFVNLYPSSILLVSLLHLHLILALAMPPFIRKPQLVSLKQKAMKMS